MTAANLVDIDPAVLAAEAAAVELPEDTAVPSPVSPVTGAVPGEEGGAIALSIEQAEAIAAGYEAGALMLYTGAARVICPNWQLTQAELRELARTTSVALAHWFPDQQLPPKYAALVAVAGAAASIAFSRMDENGLRPMRAPSGSDDPQGEIVVGVKPHLNGAAGGFTSAT